MYTALVSNLLFPLHERLKGHTHMAERRRLEQMQWLESAQITARARRRARPLTAPQVTSLRNPMSAAFGQASRRARISQLKHLKLAFLILREWSCHDD